MPANPATTWPGLAMTPEGNEWFAYEFPTGEAASLVFYNRGGRQTGNLRREIEGWYFDNNRWYDRNPRLPEKSRL